MIEKRHNFNFKCKLTNLIFAIKTLFINYHYNNFPKQFLLAKQQNQISQITTLGHQNDPPETWSVKKNTKGG